MKIRVGFIIIFCFSSSKIYCQQDTLFERGDKTISFNLVAVGNILLNNQIDTITNDVLLDARYFIHNDVAFRFGFGMTTRNKENTSKTDSSESVMIKRNHSYSIRLGLEKHLHGRGSKVDVFFGPALKIDLLGGKKTTDTEHNILPGGEIQDVITESKNPSGFTFAIEAGSGFFWFLTKNIALGGELILAYGWGNSNGFMTQTVTETITSGGTSTTTTTNSSTPVIDESLAFKTMNLGTVNLLIKF